MCNSHAWMQGYRAWYANRTLMDNPYREYETLRVLSLSDFFDWNDGFQEAAREARFMPHIEEDYDA